MSTPTTRQTYHDATFAAATSHGCDIIQHKYDGWWSRIVVTAGHATFFSRTGREYHTCPAPACSPCVLIGEHMHGTQWSQSPARKGHIYLFDIWEHTSKPLTTVPYADRYRLLRVVHASLPTHFQLVPCHRLNPANHSILWNDVLAGTYEGLVYRRSSDPVTAYLLREKNEIVVEGTITAIQPGEGKHAGRMGSVTCRVAGTLVSVGGGWSDEQRTDIHANPDQYLGRTIEISAKAQFASGSLRHPNFVRFKES